MSRSKGNRTERAYQTAAEAAGWRTQRFYGKPGGKQAGGETDGFRAFDLVMTAKGSKPIWVQVKTNRRQGITSFAEKCEPWPWDYAPVLYATRYDGEGWKLARIAPRYADGYRDAYDGRDTPLKIDKGLEQRLRNIRKERQADGAADVTQGP